jgi:hypothetical protein
MVGGALDVFGHELIVAVVATPDNGVDLALRVRV